MALIAPDNSACKEFPIPAFSPKQRRKSDLLSLKIPPQEERLPFVDPSVLHLIQKGGGGCQMTSIINGALGECKVTLNFFRITKLEMLADATYFVWFLDNVVFGIIKEMEDFQ